MKFWTFEKLSAEYFSHLKTDLNFLSSWKEHSRREHLLKFLVETVSEPDSDDDLPPEMAKFVPKTGRAEKFAEKREIPSFAALSEEISKMRIREFLNPTAAGDIANTPSQVITPNVDVTKERRRLVITRLMAAFSSERSVLGVTFESVRPSLLELVDTFVLSSQSVAIRPGSESQALLYLCLFLLSFVQVDIRQTLDARQAEIDQSLAPTRINSDKIKKIIKAKLF